LYDEGAHLAASNKRINSVSKISSPDMALGDHLWSNNGLMSYCDCLGVFPKG
jgi:hypothetical protein